MVQGRIGWSATGPASDQYPHFVISYIVPMLARPIRHTPIELTSQHDHSMGTLWWRKNSSPPRYIGDDDVGFDSYPLRTAIQVL